MKNFRKRMRKSDSCLNCGREIGEFNFCPDCGQINTHKQISLTQIVKEMLGDYFTFDSKFFRSFVPLFRRPGHLTTEYIVGKRATYILPMRLFVFTTALFFFMLALTSTSDDGTDFQSEKIKNPTDTLTQIFDKYKSGLSEEAKALIIDDLVTNYDIYTTNRSFSNKQLALIDKINSYDLKATDEEKKYFALQIIENFRLRNKKNKKYDYDDFDLDDLEELGVDQDSLRSIIKESQTGRIDEKQVLEKIGLDPQSINVDSLKLFIDRNAPKDLNKEDRFLTYLTDNYKISKRKNYTSGMKINVLGSNQSSSDFWQQVDIKGQKLADSGPLGKKIFIMQFMNHLPKVVFCMVPFLALLLKLFYIRSKIFYINHLIFSLHLHSVMLIVIMFPLVFGYLNFGALVVSLTSVAIALGYYVYSFKALKRVYRQKGVKTFIKINSIIFIYLMVFALSLLAALIYTLMMF